MSSILPAWWRERLKVKDWAMLFCRTSAPVMESSICVVSIEFSLFSFKFHQFLCHKSLSKPKTFSNLRIIPNVPSPPHKVHLDSASQNLHKHRQSSRFGCAHVKIEKLRRGKKAKATKSKRISFGIESIYFRSLAKCKIDNFRLQKDGNLWWMTRVEAVRECDKHVARGKLLKLQIEYFWGFVDLIENISCSQAHSKTLTWLTLRAKSILSEIWTSSVKNFAWRTKKLWIRVSRSWRSLWCAELTRNWSRNM